MNIIKCDETNSKIQYIGYYKMLEKIVDTIDDYSYEKRIVLIEKYIEIMKLIVELEKENQELKKQLSNSHQIKKQQKEFIEYLEEPIRMFEQGNQINISEYTSAKLDTLEEVLLKYKEIMEAKE